VDPIRPSLVVVPVRLRARPDLDALLNTMVSLAATEPDAPVIVVDDRGSDPELRRTAEAAAAELRQVFVELEDGEGRAAATNVGLDVAHAEVMDAVIVGPGVEPLTIGWLERLRARTDTAGRPAGIVGGLLLYANDFVRHGGYFFSLLRRQWGVRLRHAPSDLAATAEPCLCPTSSDLQLIRWECLDRVGRYDEAFVGDSGDIDFCVRAAEAGFDSVLEPAVRARTGDPLDAASKKRAPSSADGALKLRAKHPNVDFSRWVPAVI
jgi:GT2 family glycosyltransferase